MKTFLWLFTSRVVVYYLDSTRNISYYSIISVRSTTALNKMHFEALTWSCKSCTSAQRIILCIAAAVSTRRISSDRLVLPLQGFCRRRSECELRAQPELPRLPSLLCDTDHWMLASRCVIRIRIRTPSQSTQTEVNEHVCLQRDVFSFRTCCDASGGKLLRMTSVLDCYLSQLFT